MNKFVRFTLIAAVVALIVWVTREYMLPKPAPPAAHPPPFRKPPPAAPRAEPEAPTTGELAPDVGSGDGSDDLQAVKGIGPVYASKLNDLGISTFAGLVGADSEDVAAELEVGVATVVDWKTQATEHLG